jgi:hypothetical protein
MATTRRRSGSNRAWRPSGELTEPLTIDLCSKLPGDYDFTGSQSRLNRVAKMLVLLMSYPENAMFNWEAASSCASSNAPVPEGRQVTVPVRLELRRRLGATFSAEQLADVYGSGTDWATQLPGVDPGSADLQDLVDAAFWLHLQNASDFAGGRKSVF